MSRFIHFILSLIPFSAYELLTLTRVYGAFTAKQAQDAIQNGQRPALPVEDEEVVSDLVAECWRTDAQMRPDMSQVAMQLPVVKKTIQLMERTILNQNFAKKRGSLQYQ